VERLPQVALEDICFNAQQAAEKALKAVLQFNDIRFRFVHDLNELIVTLENNGVTVPERVQEAGTLTEYAVETRYPGEYEPVTDDECTEAVKLAADVVEWAKAIVVVEDA
jgi:HEPN domain-containing protein